MKRTLVFVLLSLLVLTACQPVVPTPIVNPVTPPASDNAVCTWFTAPQALETQNFNFAQNSLEISKMGEAVKDPELVGGKTLTVLDKNVPVYYSVTTRPSGELNEVDVYSNREGTVTLNVIRKTGANCVVSFTGIDVSPKIDGDLNEKNVVATAISLFPDDFDPEQYVKYYDASEMGYQITYIGKIGDFETVERLECIFDYEGYLMEMRLQNYGCMDAAKEHAVEKAVLEAAVTGQIQKAYLKSAENPITKVVVNSATLGLDTDGEAYYSVNASVEYEKAGIAPSTLNLVYYPSRTLA